MTMAYVSFPEGQCSHHCHNDSCLLESFMVVKNIGSRGSQEKFNEGLAKEVLWPVDMRSLDDPHVKTNLLLQVPR